jgi:predicted nucleic acid-binding protein
MIGYADTGFLCSLYAPDAHSRMAAASMRGVVLPLPLTWLHRLEFRNALRLRVFRREITAPEREASIGAMLQDLAGGLFQAVDPDWLAVTTEAERLSALHAETLGVRSLDILHVASALVLGARDFLGFDRRQSALARAAGLKPLSE